MLRNKKKNLLTSRVITPHGDRITARWVFRKGKLGVRASAPTEVYLRGRHHLGTTPVKPVKLYEGKYKLVYKRKAGGPKRRKMVEVHPGRTVWVEL